MRSFLRRLTAMLTPWWHEDEAERRERSTANGLAQSERARQRAERALTRVERVIDDYRAADERLGRISGRLP